MENAELLASLGRITRPDGDPFPPAGPIWCAFRRRRAAVPPCEQAAGGGNDGCTETRRHAGPGTSTVRRTDGRRRGSSGDHARLRPAAADRLLYCPSQLVLRAGLAANALMEGIHGPLAELLIPEEQRDKHQERIDEVGPTTA